MYANNKKMLNVVHEQENDGTQPTIGYIGKAISVSNSPSSQYLQQIQQRGGKMSSRETNTKIINQQNALAHKGYISNVYSQGIAHI
jgi:hypothetical protein